MPQPSRNPDVLVLGGGIVGLAAARELAGRGLAVELLERDRPGEAATAAAAGLLAPLSEAPEPGPFFSACRAGRDLWGEWASALAEETGHGLGYDRSGAFLVALEAPDLVKLAAVERAAHELGEAVAEVEPADLLAAIPGVAPGVRRALHLPGEHRVDNRRVAAALVEACRRRGVEIASGRRALAVSPTGCGIGSGAPSGVRVEGEGWSREAGLLVLAAGAWSGAGGGIAGLPPLPVRPVRGQMLRLSGVDWRWGGTVHGGGIYAVRRDADGLLVGATVEEAGFAAHPTPAGLAGLLAAACRLFPGLAGHPVEATWAGLRPATPDALPILGRLDDPPLVIATGHYRNGILLAPWTAREVARLALGEPPAAETAAFSPSRPALLVPRVDPL